jgi:chaperonin GroES
MSLRPVEDKIVVKTVKEEEQKTSSGLVLTTMGSSELRNQGIVIAVGPGIVLQDGSRVEPPVKPGDTIIFNRFNATTVEHNGEEYLVITIRDLLVVVEDD